MTAVFLVLIGVGCSVAAYIAGVYTHDETLKLIDKIKSKMNKGRVGPDQIAQDGRKSGAEEQENEGERAAN